MPMPKITILLIVLALSSLLSSCAASREQEGSNQLLDELVKLEQVALDRWITLDPDGYLRLYASDVTYFDPTTETRVNGRHAMSTRMTPMKKMKLPFTAPRYVMIEPHVQRIGETALLTFNLVNYGTFPGEAERELARWNATEVYREIDGEWRIAHSHWSYVKGTPASPAPPTP